MLLNWAGRLKPGSEVRVSSIKKVFELGYIGNSCQSRFANLDNGVSRSFDCICRPEKFKVMDEFIHEYLKFKMKVAGYELLFSAFFRYGPLREGEQVEVRNDIRDAYEARSYKRQSYRGLPIFGRNEYKWEEFRFLDPEREKIRLLMVHKLWYSDIWGNLRVLNSLT